MINWRFPQMGDPQNGGFIRENHIKMNDLGVPPCMETPQMMVKLMSQQHLVAQLNLPKEINIQYDGLSRENDSQTSLTKSLI